MEFLTLKIKQVENGYLVSEDAYDRQMYPQTWVAQDIHGLKELIGELASTTGVRLRNSPSEPVEITETKPFKPTT
jgi:hypothetical protein